MNPILSVNNLSKHFGGVRAVDGLSFDVIKGQICAVIGPNGSGKTTFINTVTGVYRPTNGSVAFDGAEISSLSRYQIARLGVTRTFQNLRLFSTLSVLDHVMAGRYCRTRSGLFSSVFRTPDAMKEEKANVQKCRDLLDTVGLAGKEDIIAPSLPYGQRRLLEIARALATEPSLLLLDEPAAGMSSAEIDQLVHLIFRIRDSGITIVLIEHRMKLVMNAADNIVVLNYGRKIAEGTAKEIQCNEQVIQAYLGTAYHKEILMTCNP